MYFDPSLVFFSLVVDCGPITVPVYAIYHGNSTKYLSVITFSCKEGFFLYGEASRMCQADGKWSSVNMSCRGSTELLFFYCNSSVREHVLKLIINTTNDLLVV